MKKSILIIFFSFLAGTVILLVPVQSGFLLIMGEEETLYVSSTTEEITIGWSHSVELTSWEETYLVVEKGNLSLDSTVFKSYGAGTPDTEGIIELLPNGFIRVTGIERVIPNYSLMYVPISDYYVKINEEKIMLGDFVPAYENVEIHYKKLLLYEWIRLKIWERGR